MYKFSQERDGSKGPNLEETVTFRGVNPYGKFHTM
jgi:hypothetical protein